MYIFEEAIVETLLLLLLLVLAPGPFGPCLLRVSVLRIPAVSNIASEDQWLEDVSCPFEMVPFFGDEVIHFRGELYF